MRKTLHLQASDPAALHRAAEILRQGGLVAFPTETVYGLGANALSAEAVDGIFRAKERPSWDPLIVHIPNVEEVAHVALIESALAARFEALARAFWPGSLTLLLPRSAAVPDLVTAGRPLVGVRVPAHSVARDLLRATGLPLAAPSANRFGHTSPTTAEHVLDDLNGRIDAVLDAGPCVVGVESTVLDLQPSPMVVYRAGAVTPEQLTAVTGAPVCLFQEPTSRKESETPEALPSPGVGLRHYAPEAVVRLTAGTPEALWAAVRQEEASGRRVGVMLPRDWSLRFQGNVEVHAWGAWENPALLAAELFAGFRKLERTGADVIVCPLPDAGGIRDAIRDRLFKAAKAR